MSDDLEKRLRAVEQRQPRDGRDGRDGRDAEPAIPGDRGERGAKGEPGTPGRDGKDPDPAELERVVREEVVKALATVPVPKDGSPGAKPTLDEIDLAVGRVLSLRPVERIKADAGPAGPKGDKGDRGPQGPGGDLGPMPLHEWDGTKIRFQLTLDEWGDWHDIAGPRGPRGVQGGGGGGSGSPTPVLVNTNTYMPSGW